MGTNKPPSCRKCGAIVSPALAGGTAVLCDYCTHVVKRYGTGGEAVMSRRIRKANRQVEEVPEQAISEADRDVEQASPASANQLGCRKCGAIVSPALAGTTGGLCDYCTRVVKRYGSGAAVVPPQPIREPERRIEQTSQVPTNKPLSCPNCEAIVLPALAGTTRVVCEHCDHVVQHDRALPLQPIPGRSRRVVAATIAAGVVVASGLVGALVVSSSEGPDPADGVQREAIDQVEALEQPALDPAAGARAEAEELAEASDPDIREVRPTLPPAKETRRRRAKPGSPLPETPDPAAVRRRLAAIDVSHCPGDFAITFGIRIMPDGTAHTTTVGPLRTRNSGLISCARSAIQTLRFPRSRSGLETKHELRGGALQ